jgi:hypothetical protein
MIIRKQALSRRTILRGLGTSIALPLLDAMVPGLNAASAPVRRLGFSYMPNGVAIKHGGPDYWTPSGTGRQFELSPILKPLEAFKQDMVVVSGLAQAPAEALSDGNGDHTRANATWLNAVRAKRTQGADIRSGTTADQLAALQLGTSTRLPSLELGIEFNSILGNCENGYSCAYMNSLSWSSPTTPLPPENNPRVVFERMFGDGGAPAERIAQMRRDSSVLDTVAEQMARLTRRLGSGDRARVDEYLGSIREVERRIESNLRAASSDVSSGFDRAPSAIPAVYGDHVKLMFDLLYVAFRADITRVFTFMWGREVGQRTYPEIGFMGPHHASSHHGDDPQRLAVYSKLNIYFSQLFGHFLQRLKSTPEGDGTLLDHSLVLHGAGLSDPNVHSHMKLPLALFGGKGVGLSGGRHLVYKEKRPTANLLMTMLDRVGARVENVGDSTGSLDLELLADV